MMETITGILLQRRDTWPPTLYKRVTESNWKEDRDGDNKNARMNSSEKKCESKEEYRQWIERGGKERWVISEELLSFHGISICRTLPTEVFVFEFKS